MSRVILVWLFLTLPVAAAEIVLTVPDAVLASHIQTAREWGRCSFADTLPACLTKLADGVLAWLTLGREPSLESIGTTVTVR